MESAEPSQDYQEAYDTKKSSTSMVSFKQKLSKPRCCKWMRDKLGLDSSVKTSLLKSSKNIYSLYNLVSKTHAASYSQLNLAKDRLEKLNETYNNIIREKENKGEVITALENKLNNLNNEKDIFVKYIKQFRKRKQELKDEEHRLQRKLESLKTEFDKEKVNLDDLTEEMSAFLAIKAAQLSTNDEMRAMATSQLESLKEIAKSLKTSRNAHDALCLLKDEIQINPEPTVIEINKRKKSKMKRLSQSSSPILHRDSKTKHNSIQKTVIEKTISSDTKSKNWESSEMSKTSLIQSISADHFDDSLTPISSDDSMQSMLKR
ncbi:uncharacterized protein LOC118762128 [Octopus sinensis]|uniref:Uncharacterized protein LOC118762128 n=1 Tax=Octopus sinensis TaxID=2607531 RepID=A0A7E6ENG9_9MOLL|nr:uncharacterized protein LOC118762128 [Octopus sinensis]